MDHLLKESLGIVESFVLYFLPRDSVNGVPAAISCSRSGKVEKLAEPDYYDLWEHHPFRKYLVERLGTRIAPEDISRSGGALQRGSSSQFQEEEGYFETRHSLDLAFWDGGILCGVLTMYRTPEQRRFSPEERKVADVVLHPSLETGLLRLLERLKQAGERRSLRKLVTDL